MEPHGCGELGQRRTQLSRVTILSNQRHAYMDVGAKVLQKHKTNAYKSFNSRWMSKYLIQLVLVGLTASSWLNIGINSTHPIELHELAN